mmetsp:Transcript_126992/g.253836  ORF Transcript_126992/g.253836 Transcript_126992/m.253836 type:complete len:474 (+) Transcript_126992:33-1454(+)
MAFGRRRLASFVRAIRGLHTWDGSDVVFAGTRVPTLLSSDKKLVEYWASHEPTAVTLNDLCEIGLKPKLRRIHGTFLHRDLRIRLAQRIMELQALPYSLPQREGIRDVIRWYTDFLWDLEDSAPPETAPLDDDFTRLLQRIFEEHSEVIQAMAHGVQDLMLELRDEYTDVQPNVDAILRRFFMSRIGLRFLIQHHIDSFRNRDGHSGIIQLECSPSEVANRAAKDAASLCRLHLGQAPAVLVHEAEPRTFTYVPMHLAYMLTEVLKNACRAVVERHGEGFDDDLPPVRVQIVHGHEDLTFKISDEGGGISRTRMGDIWKFMYSTYRRSRSPWHKAAPSRGKYGPTAGDSIGNPLQRPYKGAILAGYGVGLSLSRLYAQYFGGDLKILSLDGFGTDVYLHLSRLGTRCENLPQVVLYSPSMRDSSVSEDIAPEERMLVSADEEAFLQRELAAFRRKNSSVDDASVGAQGPKKLQ